MKLIKRWLTIFVGTCVVVVGIILIPIPGPGGAPVALAGLAILATELSFAQRLRERFLAFRVKHIKTINPWKRFALITGALITLYAMTTTAVWWVWASNKS